MILHLDPASPLPPYEQLRAQIATMAATGVLPPLTRLPSIRQLARDLGLATATVARAFRELERDGVIETRGRHGTYVRETAGSALGVDAEQRLAEAAQVFAVQARQLGVDAARALQQARLALDAVTGR
ncbi:MULTISPECIES: GntR family transcriptional regulator [Nonomuraea]|uniref:GntR family transcriptional regulator n=1 Tax=Nonomuraea ferruginea TaxID=46174 RepID=A0ABT4TD61_9ACTN|nr:GntR family transcriptional regulator [Nonomuraea ferruginea]MDA0647468.1 GntR family transcriptional regulator [Nonomuraea ferruginea]